MGGELVNSPLPSKSTEEISYAKIINDLMPVYMNMGMSVQEYLHEDCTLARAYKKAHDLKLKQRNYELWLQGMYIYEAIGDMSPILHAFAKQSAKPIPYPKAPYPLTEEDIREQKEKEERERMEKMKRRLEAVMIHNNKVIRERKEAEDNA